MSPSTADAVNASHAPHVTICVPAYNAESTISRTLDSILAQDYPRRDVLVCDNSSTDRTNAIVGSYRDRGVRCVVNPVQAGGAEGNWNHALSLTGGPLVALYHADDLYTPTMVRRQVEFLEAHPGVSAVFTMSQLVDERDQPIRTQDFTMPAEYKGQQLFSYPELLNAVLKHGTITKVPTMMTTKDVLARAGAFNWQQFRSAADIDLYLRMAQIGPVGIIDEPLHRYRLSPQQGTQVINRSRTTLADFFVVMDAWLSRPDVRALATPGALRIHEARRAVDSVVCAVNLLVAGRSREAKTLLADHVTLSHFITAFAHRPGYLRLLTAAVAMRSSIRLGCGTVCARGVLWAQEPRRRWGLRPAKQTGAGIETQP